MPVHSQPSYCLTINKCTMPAHNTIQCSKCIYTKQSTPTVCPNQNHPPYFQMMDKLWQQPTSPIISCRQKGYPSDSDVIPRLAAACGFTPGVDGHTPGDVTDRNLVAVLLNLDLLKLDELWPTGLKIETASGSGKRNQTNIQVRVLLNLRYNINSA